MGYIDDVAPYPKREEDVTAVALARHLACQVQADIARSLGHYYQGSGDRQGAHDFGLLVGRLTGRWGCLRLLRALIEHAPDHADEVAKQLWCDWNDGSSPPEFTWEWLTEYGIDPERVSAEAPKWERITAEASS